MQNGSMQNLHQRKERNSAKKAFEMDYMVHGFSNVLARNYTGGLCGLFAFGVDNPFTN